MDSFRPLIIFNNFKVTNITIFRQLHVLNYARALADEEPLGILRTRWGDAPIRTLTLALFADEIYVLWDSIPDGYKHRHDACILGETYNTSQAVAVDKKMSTYKQIALGISEQQLKTSNIKSFRGSLALPSLYYEWNRTTHDEGYAFCKSKGLVSICPYEADCVQQRPFLMAMPITKRCGHQWDHRGNQPGYQVCAFKKTILTCLTKY